LCHILVVSLLDNVPLFAVDCLTSFNQRGGIQ
jgi:hypothetical protein